MEDVTAPDFLTAPQRRAFSRLAADLQRVFGPRFVALVAYGPATSLCFAETISADDLDACGPLVDTWHRDALETPIVMTPDEFRRSLDAFPVEYQTILDRHVVIAGRDPFDGCRIDADDLRRACEIQARGHLIHLRQGWLDAAGHDHHHDALLVASAAPLRVLLTQVARLEGARLASPDDLPAFAEREAGMPADLVRAVLSLETGPERAHALIPRLPEYLAAAERLWLRVDRWRARERA